MNRPIRFVWEVKNRPEFITFASALGVRVRTGRSLDALRMLVAIGASPKVANDIVEGWPTPAKRKTPSLPLRLEAACRLALFVDCLKDYDWAEQLERATLGASAPIPERST